MGSFGLSVTETLPIVGRYLYVPRGPVVPIPQANIQSSKLREELLQTAKNNEAGWIRIEPGGDEELRELRDLFREHALVPAPHDVQPREILVMDIWPGESELLAQMKSKTRYNIRLAEKHGVTVRYSHTEEDLEYFIDLIYKTTSRKAIRPHPKSYYHNFFAALDESQCVVALAEHEGRVLAANLLVFFEGAAYYLHGGSNDEGRNRMAPFLLQWESVREAKRRGCTLYNFGGVNTREQASSWAGITRFKQGFAPTTQTMVFPGTYDIIVSPWRYRLYRVLQRLQSIRKKIF